MDFNKDYVLVKDAANKKGLLKNKNNKNKNLVVFVHGFTGNYLSTWDNFPTLLTNNPRLRDFDFLFWGYTSNLITSRDGLFIDNIKQLFTQIVSKHKTNQKIDIVAKGLQTEIDYMDGYENITLVGHSMGGLVIRSCIIQNLKNNNKEKLDKVKQVILFGTPNEGLDIANNKLFGSLNNHVHDIGSYNEFINDLRVEWIERVFKADDLGFNTLMVAGEEDYFVPYEQVTKYFRDSCELTKGSHEAMVKPKTADDISYKIVASNLIKLGKGNKNNIVIPAPIPVADPWRETDYRQLLMEKIRKMIAHRGLDDEEWASTLAGQYFLVRLARILNLNRNSDYYNLIDMFIKSFHINIDNSIFILEDKIKMTPRIFEKIRKAMIEEDKLDNYYSRYKKNETQNIDLKLVISNYNYALMADISRTKDFSNSMIIRLINDLAINRIIYGNGKKPIDDHGGWYPQRMPWETARILIALNNSGFEDRKDKDFINEIANKALEYLIRDIYQGKYWRSGVGNWVSDIEATALCLEAIQQWDKVDDFREQIIPVLNYMFLNEDEWLVEPDFSTENNSSDVLAATTLISSALIIINKYFKNNYNINFKKYYKYLYEVYNELNNPQGKSIKQHCTFQQITFYITRLLIHVQK